MEEHPRLELEGLGGYPLQLEPAVRIGLVDLVDLALLVPLGLEELRHLLRSEPNARVVAEVEHIQACVLIRSVQLG